MCNPLTYLGSSVTVHEGHKMRMSGGGMMGLGVTVRSPICLLSGGHTDTLGFRREWGRGAEDW